MTAFQFGIANIAPKDIAAALNMAGFGGLVVPGGLGFFPGYGIEDACFVSCATDRDDELLDAVARLLAAYREDSAFFTANGAAPALLFADGHSEPLHGV